jgi:hypothetical protein
MVKKLFKFILIFVFTIFFNSCCDNINDNSFPKMETLYLFDTCVLPKSSGMLINQQLSHYKNPNFLKNSFDKVIKSENSCPCYKKNTTGFDVLFYSDTSGNMMQIRTIHKIYIKSYHNHSGLFLYKNHLFFCRGDYEKFNFDFIKKATVFSYKPLDIWAEPKRGYYGYSQYWFMIDKNNNVKLSDFYKCN